jgi:uncharacterized protein (DUF302 family)
MPATPPERLFPIITAHRPTFFVVAVSADHAERIARTVVPDLDPDDVLFAGEPTAPTHTLLAAE